MSRDEENLDDPQNDGAGYEPHPVDPSKQQDQQQQQQQSKQPAGDSGPDEADMLFETPQDTAPTEQFGGRPQFTEGSKAKWGGHSLSADEIGIPVAKEPGYMSSDDGFELDSEQELELVDDESQLEAAAGHEVVDTSDAGSETDAEASASLDAGPGLGADEDLVLDETPVDDTVYAEAAATIAEQGDGSDAEGEFFVLDEAEREADPGGSMLHDEPLPADSYPVEEGWEPVGEGAEAEAEPEPAEAVSYEPDPSLLPPEEQTDELAETYYEEEAPAVVAAAPRRRGRLVRMMASLAAAVLVVGSGAVVVLKPEWLGLHFEPQLVERVQVARPSVQSRVPTPPLPSAPRTTTPEVVQVTPTPVPPGPEHTDPTPPPVAVNTDPTPTDPTPSAHTTPKPEEAPRYLPVGDTMWIGDFDNRARVTAEWAQVRLGAKAFAQLHNGNFFVGSVKAVNSDALILVVTDGEVSLPRVEVDRVATLDSQEYAELQQATTGFLRLSNRNRLVGTILKSVVDDNYVLQMRSDRIVVPKALVEQVVQQPGTDSLQFDQAADEEQWLREIATQQLRAMSTGVPAAPGSESQKRPQAVPRAPDKAPAKLPVKEVGRKPPVEKKSK
jgi:hypothetical protein